MEAEEGRRRPGSGRFTALLVAGFIGVAIGGAATYVAMDRGRVTPTVLEGRAFPDGDASAIGFRSDSEDADPGYSLAGATWFDGESWHDWSTDNCLTPLEGDQPIRMGVVEHSNQTTTCRPLSLSNYEPVNFASRFSMKAEIASAKSEVANISF